MKIAYFDCSSGASGDMMLGALLDAGLDLQHLKRELAQMRLSHYDLSVEKVAKHEIWASQAVVAVDAHHHHEHHRTFQDIKGIIAESGLQRAVKRRSIAIFQRLAEAEAEVHDTTVNGVHFHEVGAVDAIVDIVGSVIGLEALGIEKVTCSPLHVGSGTVKCAHGILPVPAPATARLIKDVPCYATEVVGELLTPTGAAILTTISAGFGPMPAMEVECTGCGAGQADLPIPNLLRVFIGKSAGP